MDVLISKFRIAVYTSKLRLAIIFQKFVDWYSQSPKAFEGVLFAFNCNQNEAFENTIEEILLKQDGQTKHLLWVRALVIQYNVT
ncbi:unnamed protein product [Alternaria burnsii]|nr:unnamed protein product [Alternaria burnsii]